MTEIWRQPPVRPPRELPRVMKFTCQECDLITELEGRVGIRRVEQLNIDYYREGAVVIDEDGVGAQADVLHCRAVVILSA